MHIIADQVSVFLAMCGHNRSSAARWIEDLILYRTNNLELCMYCQVTWIGIGFNPACISACNSIDEELCQPYYPDRLCNPWAQHDRKVQQREEKKVTSYLDYIVYVLQLGKLHLSYKTSSNSPKRPAKQDELAFRPIVM